MAGPAFTVLFALITLFAGLLTDNVSRKWLLFGAVCFWSLTSVGTSFVDSYALVALMRILLGVMEAFFGPAVYSLIVDFIPGENRTTANSFISFGIYVGAALSNLTSFAIAAIGWRHTYLVVGSVGVLIGIIGLIVVKEPERGRFEGKLAIPERHMSKSGSKASSEKEVVKS